MKIGRKIYYELSTGNVVLDTGERSGSVVETTREQDFASYSVLANRLSTSIGMIQLNYGQYADHFSKYPYRIDPQTKTIVWSSVAFGQSLDEIKAAKIIELQIAESNNLKTFQSSALGDVHTYLSGSDDMVLLNGEYSFVKGDDYDGQPILWYTVEMGYVIHTKEQFIKVYLDGRSSIAEIKYRYAQLESQVAAAMSPEEVDSIRW